MPALGLVELLLVQLLRSDPLLSARDAVLVGPLKAGCKDRAPTHTPASDFALFI
jgi:hypothetical protein